VRNEDCIGTVLIIQAGSTVLRGLVQTLDSGPWTGLWTAFFCQIIHDRIVLACYISDQHRQAQIAAACFMHGF